MLRIEALCSELVLEPIPAPPLDAETRHKVDDIWRREQQRRPQPFFDGKLFSFAAREGRRLRGSLVDYRRFVAQRCEPGLFFILRVRPLAVSGVLISPDGIVFGKRAAATTQDAGRWELAPSGGIDAAVDPRAKLVEELGEEVGCPRTAVARIAPLALVEDEDAHTIDLCYEVETPLSAAELGRCHAAAESREYDAIAVVRPAALGAFVADHDVIEISRALVRPRGLV